MSNSPSQQFQAQAKSSRITRVQRTALALLVLSGVINYVDRATLSIGLPLIRHDLGFSVVESGFLLSAFLFAYAFSQLPAGALVDRVGARFVLSAALGVWSLAQVLGGLVASFWQFVAVRVLLGVGESPQFPTCARIVADWFHKRERGVATGVWNCSSSLGTAIAAPLLTYLMIHLGWRWMFVTMGLAGLVVALAAYWLHRDPDQVLLTAAEHDYLSERGTEVRRVTWQDWRGLFRFRTTWGMIFGFFGAVYMVWLYYSWLPQYLEIEWHFSIVKTGWVAAVPFVCGVVGSLVGGRTCDMLLKRGFSPIASRKIPLLCALFGNVLCTVLAAFTSSSAFAVGYISVSLFLINCTSCAAWAMVTVATDSNCTGSLGSIQNFGGYLGGALAPIVTGFIVQATGSFRPALLVGALVAFTAGVAHLVLVGEPILRARDRAP